LLKQCIHELSRLELPQIFDRLSYPDEPQGNFQFTADGHDYPTFCRTVQLGQGDTAYGRDLLEQLCLGYRILPGRGIKDQKRLMGRSGQLSCYDPADLLQLLHKIDLRMETARSVHYHHIRFTCQSSLAGIKNDR